VLRQFGGLQNVNQTPGTVGCFDDSRALFKTWRDSDMRLAMTIMEAVDVKEVLRWVMEAGLCDIFLSEFTGQWHLVPWVMAPASTYADALQASEVLEPEVALRVSTTLDADVVSGVRMVYGWDHVSRGFVHETSLAGSRSSAGHGYLNLRDGSMLVVAATNDAIDYSVAQIFGGAAAGTKAATLAAAAYQLDDLPLAVITALETGDPARKYQCGVVGRIVAGVNDAIEWVDSSGVNRTAFVLEGVYTMPGLCAAVQTAMASPWTVSYSRATRRVTVTSDGGASAIRTTGPLRGRSVWPMLGFANGYNPLAPQTNLPVAGTRLGDYEREEERIYIGCADTTMDINWRSGPSGYYGTRRCCAEVVGFDWSQDSVGGRASHMSASFKNNRELAVAATDAEFGVKRELTIDGRAVVDTDTAVEARNRLLALLGKVRGFVEVSTEIHADAERGDVLPCDASLDDIGDYAVPGTDGSFAGKAFRVVNTQTSFGRSFHTELVLADMS
jgi:hypothetical protein